MMRLLSLRGRVLRDRRVSVGRVEILAAKEQRFAQHDMLGMICYKGMSTLINLCKVNSGSHVLRGNPIQDAVRHVTCIKQAQEPGHDAERWRLHSHAERGNEE
jgi:hypothetical protein